jgi:hypothetical protein
MTILGMKSLEDLPRLPGPTPWLIAALLLVFWVAMRIRILRRRQARRGADDDPVATWGWLEALAAKPRVLPVLAVLAALLALAILASFLLPR